MSLARWVRMEKNGKIPALFLKNAKCRQGLCRGSLGKRPLKA